MTEKYRKLNSRFHISLYKFSSIVAVYLVLTLANFQQFVFLKIQTVNKVCTRSVQVVLDKFKNEI